MLRGSRSGRGLRGIQTARQRIGRGRLHDVSVASRSASANCGPVGTATPSDRRWPRTHRVDAGRRDRGAFIQEQQFPPCPGCLNLGSGRWGNLSSAPRTVERVCSANAVTRVCQRRPREIRPPKAISSPVRRASLAPVREVPAGPESFAYAGVDRLDGIRRRGRFRIEQRGRHELDSTVARRGPSAQKLRTSLPRTPPASKRRCASAAWSAGNSSATRSEIRPSSASTRRASSLSLA